MTSLSGQFPTAEAGYIERPPPMVAEWLRAGLDGQPSVRHAGWARASDAVAVLAPGGPLNRRAVVPMSGWTLLLTNGPQGTDVGLLPSLAARELGCSGLRAVCTVDPPYPARVLEVFDPQGVPPLLHRRSIAAANDGGRWIFETSGEPFAFEDQDAYRRPRKADRLTADLLMTYLRELHVPVDDEPTWEGALLVEQ